MPLFKETDDVYKRYHRLLQGRIVVLEGLISSGKTTWGESLAAYLKKHNIDTVFLREPVDNDFLDMYLHDMPKYSFSFQMHMKALRREVYAQARKFSLNGSFVIIDRSMHGDMAFALMQKEAGMITDKEWSLYCRSYNCEDMEEPNDIIMLSCQPSTALDRVRKRGNKSEVNGYTLDYFERLHNAYQEVFTSYGTKLTVINVDGNITFDTMGNIPRERLEGLLNILQ